MKKKILIVEDNDFDRELLVKKLLKSGFDVAGVASGEDCLVYLRSHHVDLILLDIVMPGISGIGVLKNIREKYKPIDLPILMVTAKDTTSDIVECLDLGANDYLVKPININESLSRIDTHLNLVKLHKESLRLKEIEALNAMIITYNHEINNPLLVIKNYIDNQSADNVDDAKESLNRIEEILKKIQTITTENIFYTDYGAYNKKVGIKE